MKILKEFGISEKQLRRVMAGRKQKPKIIKTHITEESFEFAIVSDTHLCSKEERLNELHTFYAICNKLEVKHVVHAGDVVAGQGIYRGQENEIKVWGADNQIKYAVSQYPKQVGIKTYFITGNHDLAYWKTAGIDIGERIASERSDMVYLGQYQGDIELGGMKIRLIHPDGGGAYAISYKAQKIAEQIHSGKKPDILVLGHAHTSNYFFYRNIHILNGGTFEGQTSFLLRKGINPSIGGWIIRVRTTEGNLNRTSVVAVNCSWIPFF